MSTTDASLLAFAYMAAFRSVYEEPKSITKKGQLASGMPRVQADFSIISIAVALLHDDLCGNGLARSESVDLDEHAGSVGSHTHALEVVIYG